MALASRPLHCNIKLNPFHVSLMTLRIYREYVVPGHSQSLPSEASCLLELPHLVLLW